MTIEQLGSLGELISAIVVLFTLLYLAIQVRQAKNMLLIEARRSRGDRLVRFFSNEVNSPYLAPIMEKMQNKHGYGREQTALMEAYGLTKTEAIRWSAHLRILWEPTIVEYDNLPMELKNREDSFINNMARFPDQRIFLENLSAGDTEFAKRVAAILKNVDRQ